MDREGFLAGLARLLEDIPENERREALEYYENYFDDAGPENEARVIQELGGTPEQAAASIRVGYNAGKASASKDYGEYTEYGYRDTRIPRSEQMPRPVSLRKKKERDSADRTDHSKITKIVLIVLILIATSGIWLGIFSGLIGMIFGLLGGILGLIFGIAAAVLALLAGGVALSVSGIVRCLTDPALGLLMSGLGMLSLALGILSLILCVWLASKALPWASRWSYDILRKFCDWCRSKWKIFR